MTDSVPDAEDEDMSSAVSRKGGLADRRILVVEDDYLIATDLARSLRKQGAEVIGPVPSIEAALRLIRTTPAIDGALLDVNLQDEMAFAVADALMENGVPFVFATSYGADIIPARYASVGRCQKPVASVSLAKVLLACSS